MPKSKVTNRAKRRNALRPRSYGPGRCKLGDYSSLRKLMRAARRGKLPAERLRIIKDAEESIRKRIPLGYAVPR